MTFSAIGIIITALILLAQLAFGATYFIKKFASSSAIGLKLHLYGSKISEFSKLLNSEQISVSYSPFLTLLFLIEISLIIPLIISGFYMNFALVGTLNAVLFNIILITALVYVNKNSFDKNIQTGFLIKYINKIREVIFKKRK